MKVFILLALFAGALAHSRLDEDDYSDVDLRDTNLRAEFSGFILVSKTQGNILKDMHKLWEKNWGRKNKYKDEEIIS